MDLRFLVVGAPHPYGTGGNRRTWLVLNEMVKLNIDVYGVVDKSFHELPLYKKAAFETIEIGSKKLRRLTPRAFSHLRLSIRIPKLAGELARLAIKINPDVIVAEGEDPQYVLGAYLASRRTNVPWTAVLNLPPLKLWVYEPWAREVISMGRLIKTLAETSWLRHSTLNALCASCPLLVSKSILQTLKLAGHELGHYAILRTPLGLDHYAISNLRRSKESYDVLFITRLIPEKGLYDLIYICEKVADVLRDVRILIAGRFYSRMDEILFKHLILSHGLLRNVTIRGWINEQEKFSLMKGSRVMLYPSRLDAFPLVVLEALACGLPVVAYAIPAITYNYPSDAVVRYRYGHLNKMANATIKLLTDEELRSQMSQRAVKFAKRFTWRRAAECEIEAIREILEN